MALTQNILVCTDFSQASELALEAAAMLARQNDAKVTIAHVIDGPLLATRPKSFTASGTAEIAAESEVEAKVHAELKRIREERFEHVPTAKTVVIVHDDAADGIVEYAKKEKVDLVVLSTHGRTGLAHILIGSVAEAVVRKAPCPVFTLRARAED